MSAAAVRAAGSAPSTSGRHDQAAMNARAMRCSARRHTPAAAQRWQRWAVAAAGEDAPEWLRYVRMTVFVADMCTKAASHRRLAPLWRSRAACRQPLRCCLAVAPCPCAVAPPTHACSLLAAPLNFVSFSPPMRRDLEATAHLDEDAARLLEGANGDPSVVQQRMREGERRRGAGWRDGRCRPAAAILAVQQFQDALRKPGFAAARPGYGADLPCFHPCLLCRPPSLTAESDRLHARIMGTKYGGEDAPMEASTPSACASRLFCLFYMPACPPACAAARPPSRVSCPPQWIDQCPAPPCRSPSGPPLSSTTCGCGPSCTARPPPEISK